MLPPPPTLLPSGAPDLQLIDQQAAQQAVAQAMAQSTTPFQAPLRLPMALQVSSQVHSHTTTQPAAAPTTLTWAYQPPAATALMVLDMQAALAPHAISCSQSWPSNPHFTCA